MKSFTKQLQSLVLTAALFVPVAGYADTTIIANLGVTQTGQDIFTDTNILRAAGFMMLGTSFTLTNVILTLNSSGTSTSAPAPTPLLRIFDDNGSNTPNSQIAILTGPLSILPGVADYQFTGAFTFEANTSYWLVLSQTNTSINKLAWLATINNPPSGSFATDSGFRVSSNNGDMWGTASENIYQVNGTAVSVPYSASLWQGLAVVLLGGYMMVSLNRKRVYQE